MFDFDAGKIMIIGIVALIVIGPKELPRVLRQLGQAVSKMRRMGAEFQNQFMDAMREAEVADIKADLAKLKDSSNLDLPHFNPVQDFRKEVTAALEKPPAALAAPEAFANGTLEPIAGHSSETLNIEPGRELGLHPVPSHDPPANEPREIITPPALNKGA